MLDCVFFCKRDNMFYQIHKASMFSLGEISKLHIFSVNFQNYTSKMSIFKTTFVFIVHTTLNLGVSLQFQY